MQNEILLSNSCCCNRRAELETNSQPSREAIRIYVEELNMLSSGAKSPVPMEDSRPATVVTNTREAVYRRRLAYILLPD